jgi:hypothetical protein
VYEPDGNVRLATRSDMIDGSVHTSAFAYDLDDNLVTLT